MSCFNAAKLCIHTAVQMWAALFSGFAPYLNELFNFLLAFDTHLSSALCLTPSGFVMRRRSAKLGSVSDAWRVGSRGPLCTSRGSVRYPDNIQDLHHLLIDDEDYGHVQTHTAQPRNRPFVESCQALVSHDL